MTIFKESFFIVGGWWKYVDVNLFVISTYAKIMIIISYKDGEGNGRERIY